MLLCFYVLAAADSIGITSSLYLSFCSSTEAIILPFSLSWIAHSSKVRALLIKSFLVLTFILSLRASNPLFWSSVNSNCILTIKIKSF